MVLENNWGYLGLICTKFTAVCFTNPLVSLTSSLFTAFFKKFMFLRVPRKKINS
jgi:hypothetical protein